MVITQNNLHNSIREFTWGCFSVEQNEKSFLSKSHFPLKQWFNFASNASVLLKKVLEILVGFEMSCINREKLSYSIISLSVLAKMSLIASCHLIANWNFHLPPTWYSLWCALSWKDDTLHKYIIIITLPTWRSVCMYIWEHSPVQISDISLGKWRRSWNIHGWCNNMNESHINDVVHMLSPLPVLYRHWGNTGACRLCDFTPRPNIQSKLEISLPMKLSQCWVFLWDAR